MPTVQVYDVKFDTTDDGFENLSASEVKALEDDIEGQIFEIDCHPDANINEFEYAIGEEISSETGWLVSYFNYRHIVMETEEK
jgi:hypothetical protein